MNTPEQNLRAAADYIRTHGWARGMGEDGGPRCVLGALCSVTGRGSIWGPYDRPEYRAFLQITDDSAVGDFNDKCLESEDEAILLLEIAADLAS